MQLLDEPADAYEARRVYGGLMRHKIETTLPSGNVATLTGGVLSGTGAISIGGKTYQVGRSSMSDGKQIVAEFSIAGGFMSLTTVNLRDMELERSYALRQVRSWSSQLVLLDGESKVGEFRSSLLDSPYMIRVNTEVPTSIVLICVWIAMVRMAFSA